MAMIYNVMSEAILMSYKYLINKYDEIQANVLNVYNAMSKYSAIQYNIMPNVNNCSILSMILNIIYK